MQVKPMVVCTLVLALAFLKLMPLPPQHVAVSQETFIGVEKVNASALEPIATTTATTTFAVIKKTVLRKELETVCSCESGGGKYKTPRQFNADGTVVRGKINPQDIGMCQINEYYHGEASRKMGLDIYTTEGNIKYANYLYDTQGLVPWNWSKSCWE